MKLQFRSGIMMALILIMLLCLTLPSAVITAPVSKYLSITQSLSGGATDPSQPGTNLTDDNPASYWGIKPGSGQGSVVFIFDQPSLVYGLEIAGQMANGANLAIEYNREGLWLPFSAGFLTKIPVHGMVDLSHDKVVTNSIRIRITGSNIDQNRLTEIKILGRANNSVFHRIQPLKITASDNTSPTTPAEFLADRNTYTTWSTIPGRRHGNYLDWNLDSLLSDPYFDFCAKNRPSGGWNHKPVSCQGQVLFDLGREYQLNQINIYFTAELSGDLQVEIPGGSLWKLLKSIPRQAEGWYTLDLSNLGIITGQVRLTVNGGLDGAGGISEVEIWGYGNYDGDKRRPILLSPETISAPVNHSFTLEEDGLAGNVLELSGDQVASSQGITVDLNGNTVTVPPALLQGQTMLYSLPLPAQYLRTGLNFIRIYPVNQSMVLYTAAIVRKANDGEIGYTAHGRTGKELNDGLLFMPPCSNTSFDFTLDQAALVGNVEVYTQDEAQLYLYAFIDEFWVPLSSSGAAAGFVQFNGPGGAIAKLRIENPAGTSIGEIRVLGSPITNQAPVVKILWPEDGAVIDVREWGRRKLAGFVDNPDADVTVNGAGVYQNGHYFGEELSHLKLKPWETAQLAAVARDSSGREGRDTVEFAIGEMPLMTLDQPEQLTYTDQDSFTISGKVKPPFAKVTVNGAPVTVTSRRFNTEVNLKEGYNLIETSCVFSAGKRQFTYSEKREIVRCTQPLQLTISDPFMDTYVNTKTIIVNGTVAGLGTCRVTVNGVTAKVNGNLYSASVTLMEGKNTLNVKAADANGSSVTQQVTVYQDSKAPVFSGITPANSYLSNSATVKFSGNVRDVSPVLVYVNDNLAAMDGNGFRYALTFSADGSHPVTIKAQDQAGNVTAQTITVTTDTTPPLPFEITIKPADWTNNQQPVVTFETGDAMAGIDHYELAVDDQEFTRATSPHTLPVLSDGRHLITVKAIDKAGWATTNTTPTYAYIDTTPPGVPAEFKAVPGDKKIIVSWKPNTETDFKKYILKRVPAFPDGDLEFNIDTHQYTDTGVENFQSYTYSIKTLDHIDNVSQEAAAPAVKPGLAEVKVNPAVETKIEYENVVVGVPAGALSQSKTLTIMEVKNPEPLLEKSYNINVSQVFELSAATVQGPVDPQGVRFEKPVLVGIHYDLEGMYKYVKESSLKAYYYNYKNENWEVIPESFVNTTTHTVYFITDHFSTFSVQASLASSLSPEQISGMGVSPGKGYAENNQVGISYGSGTATVTAKDFVLPGKGGLDLTISRSYDHMTAQSDWGLDEDNVLQAIVGFFDFGNPFFTIFINFMTQQLDRAISKPSACYGFGRGWRLNAVWVEKNDNGQFVHLPGGGMKKINWTMDGAGWGGQGHGVFECHAGEHFIIEKIQKKEEDIYSSSNSSGERTKVGETWVTVSYALTTKEGTKYSMDGDGRLQRIMNRLGTSEIKFYYQGKNIDYILDSTGRRIDFNYNGRMIESITAAGKTVTYHYANDELAWVDNGGAQRTQYGYEKYTINTASSTLSAVQIISAIVDPIGWVNVIMGLIPFGRADSVYYLSDIETPFGGKYRLDYTKYDAVRYCAKDLTYSVVWYDFYKATSLKEIGDSVTKETRVVYNIVFTSDQAPQIALCNVYEGNRRTEMAFSRYSNSVDQDTVMLKSQTVYGENDRRISEHTVLEFDPNLEAPTRVMDQTGNRDTIVTYEYDNWGNVTKQTNSKTGVETRYAYANTNSPAISHSLARSSPYGSQSLPGEIHDARVGELILNKNGDTVIPQQTWYKYDNANGNLLEKAIRSGNTWLKTGYEYDIYGNIVKMTGPSGIETGFEYSGQYNHALLTKVTLAKLTDANDNVRTNVVLREVGYDSVTYRKRWEKDARGYVTEYQQDVLGREVKTALPDDDDPADFYPTVATGDIERGGSRSNNPTQQVIFNDGARTSTVIDPLGNRTVYIYDAFEHLLEIEKYKKLLGLPYVYSRVKVGYDDQWNITSIISPNGVANPDQAAKYTTTYEYDETNRLKKIIYPYDETLKCNPYKYYDYNDVANSVTVTDENGHDTKIQKDEVDRVIRQDLGLRAEEGTYVKFTYDALGNKTSETNGRDNTTLFGYDDLNRLIKKNLPAVDVLNDPNAAKTTSKSPSYSYEYDNEGNLVKEVSPLGTSVIHEYDEMNREIRTITSFTVKDGVKRNAITKSFYDLAGNKIAVVDAGGKSTRFEYTARGWLKRKIDPNGGMISFTYDWVGNKISETDPRGNMPGAAPNSFTAWYFYDELYRVVKAVLPDKTPPSDPNSPGDNPVIVFEYDYNGNCIKETKANGQVITYEYDGRNRLLSQSQSLNGKTYTSRFEYDGVNKKFVYDNKGNKTEYVYDALNRLVRMVFPEGNTVSYQYDKNSNQTETEDGKHNRTVTEYDALNRAIRVMDAENVEKSEGDQKSTQFLYNEEGKLTKQISPTGLVTKFFLNELGMPLQVVDSMGQSRYFDYDAVGNVTYKKDPKGTEARFEYDEMYRILNTNLQNGTRMQSLSYQYDLIGNVKQADNGQVKLIYNNADSNYDTDPFNRISKVEQVMPDGTRYATKYRYDIMGQMTGIRYPKSAEWLTYDYDKLGRLVGIPGFAGSKANPGFMYDDNSALASVKTDNGVTTTYQRDNNGRITSISSAKAGTDILKLNYVFDNANNIIQRNDNNYIYDKVSRLTQATIRGVFEDEFTKADMSIGTADKDYIGNKASEQDVTGLTQVKLDFSARSLILDMETEAENICRVELTPEQTGHRVPVNQIEVYYMNGFMYQKLEQDKWTGVKDGEGRIIIKFTPVLTTNRLKIHCNYDDLDYLQQVVDRSEFYNGPEKLVTVYQKIYTRTESYQYDALGNRTSEKILLRKEYGWEYTYYPNSNRLKAKAKTDGSEKFEYAYDANGNLTSKVVTKGNAVDTWEYAYDLLNQLEQVKKNGEVISSYIYDPNGFRVEKIGSKGKIHYVPLLNGEVGYKKELTNNKEYSYVYVGINKLARINGIIGSSAAMYFYINDHQGSCMVLTDTNGNKVLEKDHSPFGERINVTDDETLNSEEVEDEFTGKEFDEDTGLYYYNARWYDQSIGRFTTEDSVADDPNLYGYVANNPVNNIDPTGHFSLGSIKLQSGFGLFMASMNTVAALTGDQNLSSFSTAISAISAVKGMKDFADYLKNVKKIETTLSNTVNPNTGEKYTQKEIITFMRRLYYPDKPFDTACGSSIDEQGIADMLEQKCPGIMKSIGFSKRDAVSGHEKQYRSGEEIWRADKTKFDVYGEKVDVGHMWAGIDAGINADNVKGSNLKTQGLKIGNSISNNAVSILGVTVTGDLVSTAGFGEGDLMGDLYGAVLGNDMTKVKNSNSFSISDHLAQYFSPNGRWFRVAADFRRIYDNPSWAMAVNAASINLRGKPIGLLQDDPSFVKNTELFTDYLSKMASQGR